MDVVIDTNAIVADYWLRSKRWRLLISRAENELISLHVPEPIIEEAVKRFRIDVEETAKALTAAKRLADRMMPTHVVAAEVDIDRETDAYEDYLRSTLGDAGAFFDYPSADTAEVAERVVRRAKPFKADGSGYVDMLVWLRARELADNDDVALISDNHRDFGGTKQGGLHADLEKELVARGAGNRVIRYPSPSDFHASASDHAELYHAQIVEELQDNTVMDALKDAALSLLDDREAGRAALWGSVAGPEDMFLESGQIDRIELIEVTDAEADWGYANLEAHAQATYQFPVLYGEAWEAVEDGELDDLEISDPEEIVATATRTVNLHLWLDAEYDPGARLLSNLELTSAEAEVVR